MFYIQVSNGLLQPGHYDRMGPAVWVFMWCIDHVTQIDDDGVGWVLGRKPIIALRISQDMGVAQRTIERDLARLKKHGYIKTIRTPRGSQIGVSKAKKTFKRNGGNTVHNPGISRGMKNSEPPNLVERTAKIGGANIRQLPKDNINISNRKNFEKENRGQLQKLAVMKRGLKNNFAMTKN